MKKFLALAVTVVCFSLAETFLVLALGITFPSIGASMALKALFVTNGVVLLLVVQHDYD